MEGYLWFCGSRERPFVGQGCGCFTADRVAAVAVFILRG